MTTLPQLDESRIFPAWSGFCAELLGASARAGLRAGPSLSGQALEQAILESLTDDERARLGTMSSESRRGEWVTGRSMRKEILGRLGADAAISASHSADSAIVIGLASSSSAVRVGVDLELEARPVTSALGRRILAPAEEKLGLSALELWTFKEAAFKADFANQDQVVTSYRVEAWDRATRRGTMRAPSGALIELLGLQDQGWQLAFAIAVG